LFFPLNSKNAMPDEPELSNPPPSEDPWQKLTPEERKRANRHLIILYIAMFVMVASPFIVLLILKQ